MKDLEYFRKQQQKSEREQEKLSSDLNKLRASRADLEEQINAAIDVDNLSAVEKLTAKQAEIDNRITATEKIISRKQETSCFSREEIAAANNDEMESFQRQINRLFTETEEARKAYLSKLITAAGVINTAWGKRAEYLAFVEDPEPAMLAASNKDFNYVQISSSIFILSDPERDELKKHDPEGFRVIESAIRPKATFIGGHRFLIR